MIEDSEGYHKEARSQGRFARLIGKPLSINWFEGWLKESFEKGWKEVDQDPEAPKQEIRF